MAELPENSGKSNWIRRTMRQCLVALIAASLSHSVYGQCDPEALVPSGQITLGEYGFDVDCDGATIIVGARGDDLAGTDSGSAKVFKKTGGVWGEEVSLSPAVGDAFDQFGFAVAVDGNWLAVGAPFDDDKGSAAGAVYMYERVGGVWMFAEKIAPLELVAGDKFGTAVALDGARLAIGTPGDDDAGSKSGSVLFFELVGTTWTFQQKLTAFDGSGGDEFGTAVDVSGDRLLVGSLFDDDKGVDSGSAYLFELSGARLWSLATKFVASDGATDDEFGSDVSIDNEVAVVGARLHNQAGADSGAVYVFESMMRAWAETVKITSAGAAIGDHFGSAVSVFGSQLLVGARQDDDQGAGSGAAFLFERIAAGQWNLKTQLLADDVNDGDFFGWAVVLHQDVAVVTALGGKIESNLTGHAYSFGISAMCFCPADVADSGGTQPDGAVDVFDLLELLANWGTSGNGAAIAEPEGTIDVFDLLDLLAAWGACS